MCVLVVVVVVVVVVGDGGGVDYRHHLRRCGRRRSRCHRCRHTLLAVVADITAIV